MLECLLIQIPSLHANVKPGRYLIYRKGREVSLSWWNPLCCSVLGKKEREWKYSDEWQWEKGSEWMRNITQKSTRPGSWHAGNSNEAFAACLAVVGSGHGLRTMPSDSGCLPMLARKLSIVHLSGTYAVQTHDMCSVVSGILQCSQSGLFTNGWDMHSNRSK